MTTLARRSSRDSVESTQAGAGAGGAVNVEADPGLVSIVGNTFTANSADFGGALELFADGAVTFSSNTLTSNSAGNGGAMEVFGSTVLNSQGNKFVSNTASSVGGALFVSGTVNSNHDTFQADGAPAARPAARHLPALLLALLTLRRAPREAQCSSSRAGCSTRRATCSPRASWWPPRAEKAAMCHRWHTGHNKNIQGQRPWPGALRARARIDSALQTFFLCAARLRTAQTY